MPAIACTNHPTVPATAIASTPAAPLSSTPFPAASPLCAACAADTDEGTTLLVAISA